MGLHSLLPLSLMTFIFRDITPYSPRRAIDVSEEDVALIFNMQQQAKEETCPQSEFKQRSTLYLRRQNSSQ
jgi:hypothetical protein